MSDDTKALVKRIGALYGDMMTAAVGGPGDSSASDIEFEAFANAVADDWPRLIATIERLERDRDALAERCEKLYEALRNLLEAMETEARAVLAARNAEDNYSSPERELDALQNAMVAASNAEKAARTALAAPKDAP